MIRTNISRDGGGCIQSGLSNMIDRYIHFTGTAVTQGKQLLKRITDTCTISGHAMP